MDYHMNGKKDDANYHSAMWLPVKRKQADPAPLC